MSKIVFNFLYFSGINYFFRLLNEKKLVLLGYHSIVDLSKQNDYALELYPGLAVSKNHFENQISYLKEKGYVFLNFSDLELVKEGKMLTSKKSAIIYFDDGFRDIYFNAYPILKKYDARATIFLTIDFVNQNSASKSIVENAKTRNRKLDFSATPIYLSWRECALMKDIIEYGAHGVTHQKLNELGGQDLDREIQVSKNEIERNLNIRTTAFSYPHGRFNDVTEREIRKAGFLFSISTKYGANDIRELGRPLRKIIIGPEDDVKSLEVKLGAYYPLRTIALRLLGKNYG